MCRRRQVATAVWKLLLIQTYWVLRGRSEWSIDDFSNNGITHGCYRPTVSSRDLSDKPTLASLWSAGTPRRVLRPSPRVAFYVQSEFTDRLAEWLCAVKDMPGSLVVSDTSYILVFRAAAVAHNLDSRPSKVPKEYNSTKTAF